MKFTTLPALVAACILVGTSQISCEKRSYRSLADSLYLVPGKQHYYDLKEVDQKFFLPYVLEESSGLTYWKDNIVASVNDEDGRVFFYDLDKKDIVKATRFAGSGDYEGLEIVGDMMYVVKSNGDLYEFDLSDEKTVKSNKIETPLSKSNDVEGLGYDEDRNRLMLVCKGDSDLKDKKVKGQAVYGYDLDQNDFKEEPEFLVSRKSLAEYLEVNKDQAYDEGKITFRPSGISRHPIDKNWYLIASSGKLMVVLNQAGDLVATYPIPPRILSQPEGICFLPSGDLLLSSEGEGDRGYIIRFKMKTN